MSHLGEGDEQFHYSDSSHRWIAPTDSTQDAWMIAVRNHLDAHRQGRRPELGTFVRRSQDPVTRAWPGQRP